MSEPKSVAELPALLRHFGELTHCTAVAEASATRLEQALESLKQIREDRQDRESIFTYAYLIWRKPWMSVGADTYVSRLFEEAGGTNVFAQSEARYPEISLQALADKSPTCLLSGRALSLADKHIPEVKQACPHAKVEVINGDDCCWHRRSRRRRTHANASSKISQARCLAFQSLYLPFRPILGSLH